ncbi:MAG: FKBP-type peptidyl-prolyl cis-trans isomerase [Actinomycetota bacterium]
MRIRSTALLATVAAATLVLAGCGSSTDETPESESTPDATSTCMLDAQPGDTSDAITVDGEGAGATVTVPEDAEFADVERTVISEGDGEDVAVGDLLSVRYQLIDAASGEQLDSSERGEDGALPVLMETTQSSLFVAALECLPLGSSVALALPSSVLGEGSGNVVVYAESVEELPTVANGEPVEPVEGMPTVELAEDGSPTVTIPDTEAPSETEVAVLIQGDGPEVGEGDLVAVQYRGVKWSDGEEFDSSWSRGTPAQFQTSGVVNGFRLALEGQQVGSQVIVVMTPEDGYGESEGHELQDETLVFVVDILATTPVQS